MSDQKKGQLGGDGGSGGSGNNDIAGVDQQLTETENTDTEQESYDQFEEMYNLNGRMVRFRKMFEENKSDMTNQNKLDDIYNGVLLNIDHAFGNSNDEIQSSAIFVSEDNIVYPSGRHLVMYDLVNKKSEFIRRVNNSSMTVTAMNSGVTKKKELLIAIGEKQRDTKLPPFVSIYIPSRMDWLYLKHDHLPYCDESTHVAQIEIPEYRRYCITITFTDHQNPVVSYFNYQKQKVSYMSEVNLSVRKIAVNPKNYYEFLACGNSYLKLYENQKTFKEDNRKVIPEKYEKENNFVDLAYFPNTAVAVVISKQRNVFIIENFSVKYYIQVEFNIKECIRSIDEKANKNDVFDIDEKKQESTDGQNLTLDGVSEEHINQTIELANVIAHKKGFIIGTKNYGFVNVYEVNKDFEISQPDSFYCSSTLQNGNDSVNNKSKCIGITSLTISTANYLVFSAKRVDNKQHVHYSEDGTMNQKNSNERIELYQLHLSQSNALKTVFSMPMKPIFQNENPSGSIIDLSISVQKNLITTIGSDRHIRLWEFSTASSLTPGAQSVPDSAETTYKQIYSFLSKEVMNSVSIHPMGMQLAVGVREGIKIFYILEEELRVAVEIPGKMCQCIRFSNGGHYLAAGNDKNIHILDPYTFETLHLLTQHPSNIRILMWNESDSHLFSVCTSGLIYGWDSNFQQVQGNDMDKIEINQHKNLMVYGVCFDEEYDLACVSTSDQKLTIMTTNNGCKPYNTVYTTGECELTCLLLSKHLGILFAGTNLGTIRAYLWPILKRKNVKDELVEYAEFNVHLDIITQLSITSDNKYLITTSKDGSIYFHLIKELYNGVDMNANSSLMAQELTSMKRTNLFQNQKCKVHLHMNSLSLVVKSAIESKSKQIMDLRNKTENLKTYYQEELQNKATSFTDEINELNSKNAKDLDEEKQKYKKLQDEHENERNFLLKTIENNLGSHKKQLQELNEEYQNKLKIAYEQHDKLVDEYDRTKKEYRSKLDSILKENKSALSQIEKEYKDKYEDLQKNHIRLINDMKRDGEKFDVALEQCEWEYERELMNDREGFEQQMNLLEKDAEDLRDSREDYKRENEKLEKRLEECSNIEKQLQVEQEQFQEKITDHNTRLTKMNSQLKDRENQIQSKEKTIKDLRTNQQHLENFRFVLDHKIRSLKDEKVPMEQQIKNLEKHIRQMYEELSEENDRKKKLMTKLNESEQKLDVMKKDMRQKSDDVFFAKRKLEFLQYDLVNLLRNAQVSDWPMTIRDIYTKHFDKEQKFLNQTSKAENTEQDQSKKEDEIEASNVKEELLRQRNWMNSKLKSMRDKNKKLEKEKADLYIRIQKENSELINECNMLREDNQTISKKVQILEKKFKDICGISLTNSGAIDNQIENFLKKSSSLSTKHKATPFQMLKNKDSKNNRNQMLLDYYKQFNSQGSSGAHTPQVESLSNTQPLRTKNPALTGIMGDLEQNQTALANQNFEIQQLQERVSSFLMKKDDEQLPPLGVTPTPGQRVMMKSGSQPMLGKQSFGSAQKDSTLPTHGHMPSMSTMPMDSIHTQSIPSLGKTMIPKGRLPGLKPKLRKNHL